VKNCVNKSNNQKRKIEKQNVGKCLHTQHLYWSKNIFFSIIDKNPHLLLRQIYFYFVFPILDIFYRIILKCVNSNISRQF